MKTKMNLLKALRRQKAFSLIEVTVGMGILGTVVGAVLSGFTSGVFTMKMARENLRATQIMLERMETIRLYNWEEVTTSGYLSNTFTAYYDPNATNAPGLSYSGTMTVSDAPINSSYSNDMKMFTVTLSWKTGSLPRSRSFSTYISRYGMQDYIF
jgi:type II secretory pathway pseudopilin PulG